MTGFERQWQSRFERFATRHESDHRVSGWSAVGLRRRITLFEELLDRGLLEADARVLDLGCGAGTYVRLLAKRGHPTVGLDYSVPSLQRAVAAAAGRTGAYVAGDASRLPFRARSFKVVTCIGVLQTLEQPDTALSEIARVLEPGGIAVLETLNPWNLLAATRRIASIVRRRPTTLRYASATTVERAMRRSGLDAVRRCQVLLPPRSLPTLERMLTKRWLTRLIETLPGVRALAPQAYWIVGTKA